MKTRRDVLKGMAMASGGLAFSPFLAQLRAETAGSLAKLPKRFVFVSRSNGLRTYGIAPKGLETYVPDHHYSKCEAPDKLTTHQLADYELNDTMSALNPFRSRMNIINGLSAKMLSTDHGAGFGGLGAFKGVRIPIAATIDGALANAHPGIFKHLGFKLDPDFKVQVDRPRVTAFGPKQPAGFYCDPAMAFGKLFASISTDKDAKAGAIGDKHLLDFLIQDTKRVKKSLNAAEKEKLDHYLGAFESLSDRRVKLAGMSDVMNKHAPAYSDKYRSEVEIHRVEAHFDLAAASLITGLTNVITIRADEMDQYYNGLGLELHVHAIGHTDGPGGLKSSDKKIQKLGGTGAEARALIRKMQFDQVAALARKLDAVPEGDGTMLDNTLIVVMSDHGATHHSNFEEFPFVTIGNIGGAIKTGQYLHYPNLKYSDNRTIGSFYAALLHAAGKPCDGFGQLDMSLPVKTQKEPLAEILS